MDIQNIQNDGDMVCLEVIDFSNNDYLGYLL